MIKWLQACHPDVCDHEVLRKTGADPPGRSCRMQSVLVCTTSYTLTNQGHMPSCSWTSAWASTPSPRHPPPEAHQAYCGHHMMDRKQQVRLRSTTSHKQTINASLPQRVCSPPPLSSFSTVMTEPSVKLLMFSTAITTRDWCDTTNGMARGRQDIRSLGGDIIIPSTTQVQPVYIPYKSKIWTQLLI